MKSLGDNGIDSEGVTALGEMLQQYSHITSLNLSGYVLSSVTSYLTYKWLQTFQVKVTYLTFSMVTLSYFAGNKVNDTNIQPIADAIKVGVCIWPIRI